MIDFDELLILEAAIEGFEKQRAKIDSYIRITRESIDKYKNPRAGRYHSAAQPLVRLQKDEPMKKAPGKRQISAEGRARIAEAQRKRWARSR